MWGVRKGREGEGSKKSRKEEINGDEGMKKK
jgi:hypothetical protein